MNKAHLVNLYYSVFLVLIGLAGFYLRYREAGDFQYTALIPLAFGIILIFMNGAIRNQNKTVAHVSVGLVAIMLIMSLIMLVKNLIHHPVLTRKSFIFILIIIVSALVLTAYIIRFRNIRKTTTSLKP
jgi:uncharacterized membrane protein